MTSRHVGCRHFIADRDIINKKKQSWIVLLTGWLICTRQWPTQLNSIQPLELTICFYRQYYLNICGWNRFCLWQKPHFVNTNWKANILTGNSASCFCSESFCEMRPEWGKVHACVGKRVNPNSKLSVRRERGWVRERTDACSIITVLSDCRPCLFERSDLVAITTRIRFIYLCFRMSR